MTFGATEPQNDAQEPAEQHQRGWLGLRTSDWAQLALVLTLGTIGPGALLLWAQQGPAARQPLGLGLALALAASSGGLLVYVVARRRISELLLTVQALISISREALAFADGLATDLPERVAITRAAQLRLDERIDRIEQALSEQHLGPADPPADALDRLILQLLTEDPSSTDEEIGRHPGVHLERSQVARRRQRLAAAGYAVARKRQGQRPSRAG